MNGTANDYRERLKSLQSTPASHKLAVICSDAPNDMKILNVGRELATAIEGIHKQYGSKGESLFQLEVGEALKNLINTHTYKDKELGEMIVLSNIGILFEPSLGINIVDFLKKISRTTLTVLLWPGEIGEDCLFFLSKDSGITLKQTDINYVII